MKYWKSEALKYSKHYEDLDKMQKSTNNVFYDMSIPPRVTGSSCCTLISGDKQHSLSDTALHQIPPSSDKKSPSFCSLNGRHNNESINLFTSSFMEMTTISSNEFLSGCDQKREKKFKTNICLLAFIVFYLIYLMFGGLCFREMEAPLEAELRRDLKNLRQNFLNKNPQLNEEDLEEFLSALITASDRGISPLKNASNEMNWSFGQALFFSSTVVTTIGYGRVTPLSQPGKVFCIIYAIIGIPLTLVLLSALVEKLLVPANLFLGYLNFKFGHLYQPLNIRIIHLSIVVLIVAALFFAIPTFIFAYIEPQWGLLDAFYYCFISLTTIGLGDYVPGEGVSDDYKSIYKMFITLYLILGLIAMMFTLTIFYDIPQLNLGQLFTENSNGETEKLRLSSNKACYSGTSGLYIPQTDEQTQRVVVRIRSHNDDSPSPDEPQFPSFSSPKDKR